MGNKPLSSGFFGHTVSAISGASVIGALLVGMSGCASSVPGPTISTNLSPKPESTTTALVPPAPVGPVSSAVPTAQSKSATAVIYDCDMRPVTRPQSYLLFCGDGAASLENLAWSNWGQRTASATGLLVSDDCIPDCADGTPTPYTATVNVTNLGSDGYTVMRIDAPLIRCTALDFAIDSRGPVETSQCPAVPGY